MFLDNLSVHKTPRVLEAFEEAGIEVEFFPVRSACDLSPLDNAFFANFKNRLGKYDCSTKEKKLQAAHRAYNSISAKSVIGYWRKCGLLEVTPDDETVLAEIGINPPEPIGVMDLSQLSTIFEN